MDWDQIQEIYHEALKLSPTQRSAFIARAANQDPELVREVNELVGVGASLGDFLETPIAELPFTSPVENLVGTKINERYVIEKEIGRGGMGQLYLASDQNTHGTQVVLKFLLRELLENEFALQKFKDESKALARIQHPNVVRVLDTGEFDGRPFFAMQYIDGETLDQRIPQEGMRLEHAASILKQVGAALEHVHEKGVFHRDLKPTNIMLRRATDSVVIVDFGIAKVIDPTFTVAPTTEVSAGTLKYMSPEQLQGREITAASDIYSMAVVAYEMITGRRPFNATSQAQMLEQQRAGVDVKPIHLRRDLPPKAQQVLLRGLSFKPAARYQNAKQFGDELAQALLDVRPGSGLTGKRWLRAAMIVLGVSLLSFAIYILRPRESLPPVRSFDYYVTVQRMRDGQPYQSPYRSHGEEVFGGGDTFHVTVSTPVDAFLYIFHEESPKENSKSFKLIFPRQSANDGSASLGADKSVDSEWMTFEGSPGAENFWIVWSTTPVAEMESVKNEAFKNAGGLSGDTLVRVKQYLTTKNAEIKAITNNYNTNQTAIVRTRHDPLVALAQFKHR